MVFPMKSYSIHIIFLLKNGIYHAKNVICSQVMSHFFVPGPILPGNPLGKSPPPPRRLRSRPLWRASPRGSSPSRARGSPRWSRSFPSRCSLTFFWETMKNRGMPPINGICLATFWGYNGFLDWNSPATKVFKHQKLGVNAWKSWL